MKNNLEKLNEILKRFNAEQFFSLSVSSYDVQLTGYKENNEDFILALKESTKWIPIANTQGWIQFQNENIQITFM